MSLTEKQKNCPYCRDSNASNNLPIWGEKTDEHLSVGSAGDVELDEANWLVPEENYYLYQENLFKFCPMCGRPLNEEKE